MTYLASASAGTPSRFSKRRRVLIFPGMLLLVVLLFYGEEDWRGKRTWEMCKRDLAAQGQLLDAESWIPPRVPDDQNVLKAPISPRNSPRAAGQGQSYSPNSVS